MLPRLFQIYRIKYKYAELNGDARSFFHTGNTHFRKLDSKRQKLPISAKIWCLI